MDPFSLDHIFSFPRQSSLPSGAARGSTLRQISPLARARCLSGAMWTDSSALFIHPSLALSKTSPAGALEGAPPDTLTPLSTAFVPLEVWGLEPQTYGLQSHRSSH